MSPLIKSLVQKHDRRGSWLYLLWLLAYGLFAYAGILTTAAQGHDYALSIFIFSIPALISYIQFRVPTLLGWLVLFVPTAIYCLVLMVLVMATMIQAMESRDIAWFGLALLIFAFAGSLMFGFIYYRPGRNHLSPTPSKET